MLKQKSLLIIVVSFLFFSLWAQKNGDQGSLDASSDTAKISAYIQQGKKVLKANPNKAAEFFKKALDISINLGDDKRTCELNGQVANALSAANKFDKALPYDLEALRLAKALKDENLIAMTGDRVCTVYFNLGEYSKALGYGVLSAKASAKQNNKTLSANTFNTLGSIHLLMGNYDKANENFENSLQLFIDLKDSVRISSSYGNIASVFGRQNKAKEQMEYTFRALNISKLIRDTVGQAYCYLNIADAHYKERRLDSTKVYYNKALQIAERIKYTEPQIYISGNLNYANVDYDTKNYASCLAAIRKVYSFAQEVGDKRNVLYCYSFFADVYEQTGDLKESIKFQKLYISLNDSLFNIDKNNQITEMQTKYDTEKKEAEIDKLTQTNQIQQLELTKNRYLILGLVGAALLIMVIAILLIGRNRLKSNQTKMEVEQKLFRSQMNPHFIFNSLIAIQNYVYKHQPSEVAGYISRFAKLMRMILENSRSEFVTVEKELDMLTHYLELQQLRFQDKFDFTIEVDEHIDAESVLIPPMLSQPFIENAIEHGIMNKTDGKGKIELKLVQLAKAIEITITDNGVGIEQTLKMRSGNISKHASLATTITKERIEILNKKSHQKFELDIQELKSAQGVSAGTRVRIVIPES